MTTPSVTPEHAIRVLNEALARDHEPIRSLFGIRASVSPQLAAHPTIQVRANPGRSDDLGLLGLLNGIFGTRPDGWGYISGVYGDTGRLERFELTAPGPFMAPDVRALEKVSR